MLNFGFVARCDGSVLQSPNNGAVSIDTNSVQMKAKYSCGKNYELQGSEHSVCITPGVWYGGTPTCESK